MPATEKKTLMRSIGEFFGHIVNAVKSEPGRKVVRTTSEETQRDDGVILRRTTIDEIEVTPTRTPPTTESKR